MLNNKQIKLVQTAVRKAGLRGKGFDGRYRLILGQYKQPNGKPVTSCKQLNSAQVEDLLAICEANGWQMPDKPADHYRKKVAKKTDVASYAQQAAIDYLRGDLGWDERQLAGFVKRMTHGKRQSPSTVTPREAWVIIEGLKNILGNQRGTHYSNLNEVKEDVEAKDGETTEA